MEMFLFFSNIGRKTLLTFSFCFNGMFSLIYIKRITSPHNIKDRDPFDNVNGSQPLTNVTMNYILDITGSHICYCHIIPVNQTLKQWMGQKILFLWGGVAPSKLFQNISEQICNHLETCLVNFKSNSWTGFFIIAKLSWNGSINNKLSKMTWSLPSLYNLLRKIFFIS